AGCSEVCLEPGVSAGRVVRAPPHDHAIQNKRLSGLRGLHGGAACASCGGAKGMKRCVSGLLSCATASLSKVHGQGRSFTQKTMAMSACTLFNDAPSCRSGGAAFLRLVIGILAAAHEANTKNANAAGLARKKTARSLGDRAVLNLVAGTGFEPV